MLMNLPDCSSGNRRGIFIVTVSSMFTLLERNFCSQCRRICFSISGAGWQDSFHEILLCLALARRYISLGTILYDLLFIQIDSQSSSLCHKFGRMEASRKWDDILALAILLRTDFLVCVCACIGRLIPRGQSGNNQSHCSDHIPCFSQRNGCRFSGELLDPVIPGHCPLTNGIYRRQCTASNLFAIASCMRESRIFR